MYFIIILFLIFKTTEVSANWFCKENSSNRVGNRYEVCGIGKDFDLDKARKKSLLNALEEFDILCSKSNDCNNKSRDIYPLRTECEMNSEKENICYRAINVMVDLNKTIEINNNFKNEDQINKILNTISDFEEYRMNAPKLSDFKKNKENIYIIDSDEVGHEFKSGTANLIFYEKLTKKNITGYGVKLYKLSNESKELIIKDLCILKDGEINVWYRTYYQNGKIESETEYKSGVMTGNAVKWHENGNIKSEVYMFNNQPTGILRIYYPTGSKELEQIYDFSGELITGTSYYENGQVESISNYKNGEYNGKRTVYFENGGIRLKSIFLNGKLIGEAIMYYENGGIHLKNNYLNGKLNGESIMFNENGQVKSISNYKDGEYNGKRTVYFENGQIQSISNYKNGKLNGLLYFFNDSGKISSQILYKNDKKNGKAMFFQNNGKLCISLIFKNDDIISGRSSKYRKLSRVDILNFWNTGEIKCD